MLTSGSILFHSVKLWVTASSSSAPVSDCTIRALTLDLVETLPVDTLSERVSLRP